MRTKEKEMEQKTIVKADAKGTFWLPAIGLV